MIDGSEKETSNVTVGHEQKYGRTWPDLLHPFVIGLLFVLGLWVLDFLGIFNVLKDVPLWVVVAMLMSLIFIPFLVAMEKQNARLVLVMDAPDKLTEWRLGAKYPIEIEGTPLNFQSRSGVRRLFLTDFEPDKNTAKAHAVTGGTPFDFIRDGTAFMRLSKAYSQTLRGEQIVKEMVGVEAQRASGKVADQMLRILYGAMDMSELETALGLNEADTLEVENLTVSGIENEVKE